MRENKHTPGPWYASEEGGNWRAMAADENGGYTIADMCCDDQEANARRIVACVNACAGVPTGALEDMVTPIRQHLNSADIHAAKLVKQRDELLAELEWCAQSLNPNNKRTKRVFAAIAIAKGDQL